MNFTIGADPEFFLKNKAGHQSAIGLIGGSKLEPKPLEKEGFAVLEDNVAVEFNIAPAHNHKEFVNNIQYVMQELKKTLPEYSFSEDSAVIFKDEQLQHPQALEFGCEPDFNAWTMEQNPRPKATNQNLRSAGGHIHIGTNLDTVQVIRAMDLFVGVPSIKLDKHGELRRQLYGNAGACRFKYYGVEYRTLSNFWIFSKDLIEWVYNQTKKALEFVEKGNTLNEKDGVLIQAAINHSNEEAYGLLVSTYKL